MTSRRGLFKAIGGVLGVVFTGVYHKPLTTIGTTTAGSLEYNTASYVAWRQTKKIWGKHTLKSYAEQYGIKNLPKACMSEFCGLESKSPTITEVMQHLDNDNAVDAEFAKHHAGEQWRTM